MVVRHIVKAGARSPSLSLLQRACALCTMRRDFGGILAPQLLLLANKIHFRELPFLVMGLTSLVASALVLMLPETRGMQQADTVAELHRILKDHKAAGQQRKD